MADVLLLDRPQPIAAPDLCLAKVAVTGGFGTGKTTLIKSACSRPVFGTEEPVSALLLSDGGWTPQEAAALGKTTTTAALDFARLDMPSRRRFYLYGSPGRMRFWTIWQDLCDGVHAAVVVAEARRLASSFAAMDFFDTHNVPFVVAVNTFPATGPLADAALRDALDLPDHTPLLTGDLRDRAVALHVFQIVDELLTIRQRRMPST